MPWLRACAILLLVGLPVSAADWPQWLGPHRDASSVEKVAPWKGDLQVVWRRNVGEGHSSPVVAGGRVYVGSADGHLYVLDAAKGTEVQKVNLGSAVLASPAVADGRLVIGTDKGVVYCLGAKK